MKQVSVTADTRDAPRHRSGGVVPYVLNSALGHRRVLYVLSFLVLFVLPASLGALYFGVLASDEYVTEARFTVRTAATQSSEGSGPSPIVQSTLVVVEFLRSRALVEQLEKEVDLRQLYSNDAIDYLSRLPSDAPIEKFVRYWRSMIGVSVQPSGIITLSVGAFSAADAARIAEACIRASEAVLNRLDDGALADALATAREAQHRAEREVAATREALREARDRTAVLNSSQSTEVSTKLLGASRNDLLLLEQQYNVQARFQKDGPQIRVLQAKIAAAKQQVANLEAQQTTRQKNTLVQPALSDSFKELDYKTLQNQTAEAQYAEALTRVEGAQLLSKVKRMYVEVFLHPTPPQEAKLPHRVLFSLLVAGASLAIWVGCLMLIMRLRAR